MRSVLLLALLAGADALKGPALKGGVRAPKTRAAVSTMTTTLEESENQVAQIATDLTITTLRLGTCALMVHHGIDKLTVHLCSDARVLPACAYVYHCHSSLR